MDPRQRVKAFRKMPRRERRRLLYAWRIWARPDQYWEPGPEVFTVYLAGRGWGKTRVGAEAVIHVARHPELCGGRACKGPGDSTYGEGGIIGIAGRTANDVNQTMLYGPSGIMTISPPWFRPVHNKADKTLTWPNGVVARLMSGDVPDSFRGPNFGFLWADELPHWKRADWSWKNAKLALRHGEHPRCIVTTTPLGTSEIVELVFETDDEGSPIPDPEAVDGYREKADVRIVRGSTYDNAANLASNFVSTVIGEYAGTDVGEQELEGRILLEVPGAIWRQDWFRRCDLAEVPDLRHVVLAIDPAVSKKRKSAETGMVVAGLGEDNRIYLLEDASGKYSPKEWAAKAFELCTRWGVETVVEEENNGGELVAANLENYPRFRVPIEAVRAHKSKERRARMVSPGWQHGGMVHAGDSRMWRHLEWQMTHFDPGKPEADQRADRMDAAVWAAIYLRGGGDDLSTLKALGNRNAWELIKQRFEERDGRQPRRRRGKKRRVGLEGDE